MEAALLPSVVGGAGDCAAGSPILSERDLLVGARSAGPSAAGPPLLSPTPHRVSVPTPALLLGFWFKLSGHYEAAYHLGSFGVRGGDEQGLRSGLQLSELFGVLCACVTQAMADLLPEVGLDFFFKEVICPEVGIGAVSLDCK